MFSLSQAVLVRAYECTYYTYTKKESHSSEWLSYWMRQNLTLPGSAPPSTIGAKELNFCVRYENRWTSKAKSPQWYLQAFPLCNRLF